MDDAGSRAGLFPQENKMNADRKIEILESFDELEEVVNLRSKYLDSLEGSINLHARDLFSYAAKYIEKAVVNGGVDHEVRNAANDIYKIGTEIERTMAIYRMKNYIIGMAEEKGLVKPGCAIKLYERFFIPSDHLEDFIKCKNANEERWFVADNHDIIMKKIISENKEYINEQQ